MQIKIGRENMKVWPHVIMLAIRDSERLSIRRIRDLTVQTPHECWVYVEIGVQGR